MSANSKAEKLLIEEYRLVERELRESQEKIKMLREELKNIEMAKMELYKQEATPEGLCKILDEMEIGERYSLRWDPYTHPRHPIAEWLFKLYDEQENSADKLSFTIDPEDPDPAPEYSGKVEYTYGMFTLPECFGDLAYDDYRGYRFISERFRSFRGFAGYKLCITKLD